MKRKRKLKLRFKKLLVFSIFMILIPFISKLISNTFADSVNYIYLDLNCDNITINATSYAGCVYKTTEGSTESLEVSGTHQASNYYYIYQSNDTNKATTGYVDTSEKITLPSYSSLNNTINSFINNTDVEGVISTWKTEATEIERTSTKNRISISGSSTFDVTIDNLWSSYQVYNTSRRDGGISVIPSGTSSTIIKLKGENRFGNIFYTNSNTSSSLKITSIDGDNETTGALIVANINSNSNYNYYNSGIGGSDNGGETVKNLKLSGGTIYVGTTTKDNCTAIGGGGNGLGNVIISGGNITAVSSSTGTAIGGGIGQSSRGGDADVQITGGIVYAYNFGKSYNATFVPGVAIGGGSSQSSTGNLNTTVSITGGIVYAQSVGGVAIGGGSSATKNGGPANITIEGMADVTANSVSGSYTYSGKNYTVASGSGIGGGTGGTSGNGGDATVTINGGKINSGTIGGGETNNTSGTVGSATVKISDGEVKGRILMHVGTFEIDGGILTGGQSENGGCVQMYSGTATMLGGEIKNCTATNDGGAIYIAGGTFYSKGGKIYNNKSKNGAGVYIADGTVEMSNGSIELNESILNGGGIYIGGNGQFKMTGGTINNNKSTTGDGGAIYLTDGSIEMTNGTIESNESNLNGGGISIGGSGTFTMDGGTISKNSSNTGNGGGIYIANGNIIINDGDIKKNKSYSTTGGLGGGICVSSGNITMYDGNIEENEAINGGGFYLTQGTFEIQNGSSIRKNKAENGGGGYVLDGVFNLTGGNTSDNIATENGGGYFIINTETSNLSNGIINNNTAKNGGGFYQTQTNENITTTTLSGTCYVNNNTATNGNGGGVYVDGGSTFRIISGKVIYNTANGNPNDADLRSYIYKENEQTEEQTVYAKDSSAGVGGGVYINNGIFTMKNTDGTNGTSAIFGNIASYAADDLFSYGNNFTTFDAIPVTTMEKDDAYLNSTDWFEDYPEGEYHKSLKISDNGSYITSNGRYQNITSEILLVKADSVLTTSNEYICITMGANVGNIILKVDDNYVGSDHTFIYTLEDENSEVTMKVSLKQGIATKLVNVPIGSYTLTLDDNWSWRYNDKFIATIKKGNDITTLDSANVINMNVIGGQTLNINTKYTIENKKYFTKNIFAKIPLDYSDNITIID